MDIDYYIHQIDFVKKEFIPSKLDNRLLGRSQAPPLFALSSSSSPPLAYAFLIG
ncbi:hypothetical protein B4119_0315 [Parageobacillus caldoxylosilyticus]|uniref:Uncharacterized protein n=1 Tax=Saccharococcus caldoxylosilyticus TaxID=81408 RepID=A0A150M2D9_9BACL|nr:hypothetical protein B4119_0315 [Parageobacillus caldoxylosilyticus]